MAPKFDYVLGKLRLNDAVETGVTSVNGQGGDVVLDADDIDDTSTANKFVTAGDLTTLGNTSGTNTGDQDLSGYSLTSHNHTGVYEPVRGLDDNYVTDAQLVVIGNTSGTNTGDQNISSLVTGAASSTDNAIVRFDSTTGKLIQNSSTTISDDGSVFVGGATEPPTRSAISRIVQIGQSAGFAGVSNANYATVNNNLYIDSAGVAKYRTNGSAQRIFIDGVTNDRILLQTAVDGVADNAITFTSIAYADTTGFGLITDDAYGAGWNGSLYVPTKNAVYDQMELKAPLISPSFTTPSLGVATATSINGATITSGTLNGSVTGTNTGDQTITNSSDATSHTVTLSASGGSIRLVEGANITLTTTGTGSAGVVTIASTAPGTGDVVGPASATDNAIARFDSTTGKLLQNSSTTIADDGSLAFEGNASKTLSMARHTTANTAGNGLTVKSGGATSGATNKNGGDMTITSGESTGTGSSSVYVNAYRPTSSGTSDGTATTIARFWNPSSSSSAARMLVGSSAGTDSQIGINLFGNNDTNVYVQRITSSAAGKSLTVQAGGAFSGGTDLAGGSLTMKSGISTGTGTSSFVVQTPTPGSTGTADNSFADRLTINSTGATFAGKITMEGSLDVGYKEIPQNSKSADYTLVLGDSGKHIYHPSADTTARTMTIPANASVAYPIGTALTFINDTSAGVMTIAITSDTLVLAGAGTTGSRTLAANGIATAVKVTSTRWIISGSGLS